MDRSTVLHLVNVSYRSIFALCLLIVLSVSVGGCQTASHATPSLSATDTAAIARDFGSLVVGLQDETVWLLLEDEAPQLLTQGFLPRISPDGHWVLVGHHPEQYQPRPVYWLIDTHDHTEMPLLLPVGGNTYFMYGLAWSPDSTQVAFTFGYSHGSVALWHVESKSNPFLVTPLSIWNCGGFPSRVIRCNLVAAYPV